MAWREETNELDIFHPMQSGSLQKTEEAVRNVLKAGSLSRDGVFTAVQGAAGIKVRREWVRKTLKDLLANGVLSQDPGGNYSLVVRAHM